MIVLGAHQTSVNISTTNHVLSQSITDDNQLRISESPTEANTNKTLPINGSVSNASQELVFRMYKSVVFRDSLSNHEKKSRRQH